MHHRAQSKLGRRYTYRPPPATHRMVLGAPSPQLKAAAPPPDSVDLRPFLATPRDQGAEGSCSGMATAALREALHAIATGSPLPGYLSPAYLYGKTRQNEGRFPADSGCTLADEMATLQGYGVCPESFLPYTGNPAEAPTPDCDVAAVPFRIGQPLMVDVDDHTGLRQVLAANMPVAFGMSCYESFERTGPNGVVPEVDPSEGLLGGHALLMVGYDSAGRWLIRNSWGMWGLNGYAWLPPDYTDHFSEAWTASPVA